MTGEFVDEAKEIMADAKIAEFASPILADLATKRLVLAHKSAVIEELKAIQKQEYLYNPDLNLYIQDRIVEILEEEVK